MYICAKNRTFCVVYYIQPYETVIVPNFQSADFIIIYHNTIELRHSNIIDLFVYRERYLKLLIYRVIKIWTMITNMSSKI
jgi:hypothetical protein